MIAPVITNQPQHRRQRHNDTFFHHTAGDGWNRHMSATLNYSGANNVNIHGDKAKHTKVQEEAIAIMHLFYAKALPPIARKVIFTEPSKTT